MGPTTETPSAFGQCVQNTYGILLVPPYNRSSQRIYASIEKDWSRNWPGSSTKSNLECEEMVVRGRGRQGSGDVFRMGDERRWTVRCADGENGGVMAVEKIMRSGHETGVVGWGSI